MLKEVIVVEGKSDVVAIKKALEADCVITEGFLLASRTLRLLDKVYSTRGIIILTDPDSAGERIRKFLSKRYPNARHAFIPRSEAYANHDIGVEQAKPEAILAALAKVRTCMYHREDVFLWGDIISNGLTGKVDSADKRALLGEILGIGYANTKQFLFRLNHYGVTREEFFQAIQAVKEIKCNQ